MQYRSSVSGQYSPLESSRSLLSESLRSNQIGYRGRIAQSASPAHTQTAGHLASSLSTDHGDLALIMSGTHEFVLENYRTAWKLDNLSKNLDSASARLNLGHLGPQSPRSLAQLARSISPFIDDEKLQHPSFEPLNQARMDEDIREVSRTLSR